MSSKSVADETAERLTTPVPRVPPIPPNDFLSTGITTWNMTLTGFPDRGICKGTYLYLIGDSESGKTWFAHCLFAEAARNRHFDEYRFVFDNAENGALLDVQKFFGQSVLDRLEPPHKDDNDEPVYSNTVLDFYLNVASNCRCGPCIYVLDSMDALNDEMDETQFDAMLKNHEGESVKVPGSMGMGKAKTNSKNINRVARELRESGSILVVISQTRDLVGSHIPGQKTRSGGKALKFFAHIEAWTSVKDKITKTYLGKERDLGSYIQIDVRKNRFNGRHGKVPLVPFLTGHGMDDVGACVEYLIGEKYWTAPKSGRRSNASDDNDDGDKRVHAPEFNFTGTREQLIQLIQNESDEWELRQLVAKVWQQIVDKVTPVRKPRYT